MLIWVSLILSIFKLVHDYVVVLELPWHYSFEASRILEFMFYPGKRI